jgi:hypothetical protein
MNRGRRGRRGRGARNENREKRENNGIEKKSVTGGGFIKLLRLFY